MNVIHEIWALHELFLRMGIDGKDVYLQTRALTPQGEHTCAVLVMRDGETFSVALPPSPDYDPDSLALAWRTFIRETYPAWTKVDMSPLWERSFAARETTRILLSMVSAAPKLSSKVLEHIDSERARLRVN